jgi:hypothetical protein
LVEALVEDSCAGRDQSETGASATRPDQTSWRKPSASTHIRLKYRVAP